MLLAKLNQTQSSVNGKTPWSNREINLITQYKSHIKDIEQLNLQNKIVNKQVNQLGFYQITLKQDLPKYLQKMKFQTLHCKENIGKVVKIWKKQKQTNQQKQIRKKLKENGHIMYLSEIYQNLGQPNQFKKGQSTQITKQLESFGGDLQEWQKNKSTAASKLLILRKKSNLQMRNKQSRIIEQKLSELQRRSTKGTNVNYFKQGSNYKKQIQKQLDIIYFTHSNQQKQINRYTLIENSSKLLKKQLDERKLQVEENIKSKLKILNETRIEHHNLYEEKSFLMQEERLMTEEMNSKQMYGGFQTNMQFNNSSTFHGMKHERSNDQRAQKKMQIQQNQIKIMKNKRLIQSLQNAIQSSEEQLRSIMVGQLCFYKTSLKMGMDCRDNGLGWILRRLRQITGTENKQSINNTAVHCLNNNHKQYQYEFPTYLDKKSKDFLIIKTQLEDQLDNLMEQKRKFVNQIGQSSNCGHGLDSNSKSILSKGSFTGTKTPTNLDRIVEDDVNGSQIPKKYRRSLRKITMLNQEYAQNQSLIEFKKKSLNKSVQFSSNIDNLSGKKLYQTISEKIKFFDFSSKSKKDKLFSAKNSKLLEYQSLLNLIKEIHIKIEDLDISHENHLVNHYKDNREVFFEQAAACFGYKKAYSMIIKHFSWKTGKQTVQI